MVKCVAMLSVRIQIYILSRDRLNFAREAISSALEQNIGGIEIIISDNSDQDDIGNMILSEFPEVNYIRRRPALESLEHFRTVIEESSGDYVVFFHDDDILDPDYVRSMRTILDNHPDVVAVGCNAKILRSTKPTDTLFMTTFTEDIALKSPEKLLDFYLRFNNHRAAPFPGYMYRRSAIKGLYLDPQDGGKHSDVTFLISLIKRGNLFWMSKPLMQYRMHDSNDSVVENVGQRLRLLRYIFRNTNITPRDIAVQEFRFRYWARWWRSLARRDDRRSYRWRRRVVLAYLWRQAIYFAFTKPGLWSRMFSGAR